MANGESNGRPHLSLTVIVAIASLVLGIGAGILVSGGYIRQIEINSGRLVQLEQNGSQSAQEARREIAELHTQFIDSQRTLRSREYWEALAANLATLNAQTAELQGTRARWVIEWANLLQRVARLEQQAEDADRK